jgi:dihydrofolate reductase
LLQDSLRHRGAHHPRERAGGGTAGSPRTRKSVEFYSGDLAEFVNGRLRPAFGSIWFVGGGQVPGECLRLGPADEVRYSIIPVLIGDGIPFFEKLEKDIALHLAEVKAYKSGMVALRCEVRR